jgi:hypothetical protein
MPCLGRQTLTQINPATHNSGCSRATTLLVRADVVIE